MPETITYGPARMKAAWMILIFSAPGYFGYRVVSGGVASGWWLVGLAVFGIAIGVTVLLPGSTFIRISPENLTISNMYRKTVLPWADIQEFDTAHLSRYQNAAVYRLVESKRKTSALDKGSLNYDGAIVPIYEVNYKILCGVLQDYLQQIQKEAGITPSLQEQHAQEVDVQTGESKRKKYSIVFGVVGIFVLVGVKFSGPVIKIFHDEYEKAFAKIYREKFMKECQGKDSSEKKTRFCECCAAAGLSQLSSVQLMKNDASVTAYFEKNIFPVCGDRFLSGNETSVELKTDLEKTLEAAIVSRPTIPEKVQVRQAPKEPPKQEVPPQEKSFESEDLEGQKYVHLKNGQVMRCRIASQDKNGIWIEIEGGKVYFTKSDIVSITDEP